MSGFSFPGRPGRELDEPLLDMLLTGGRSLRMPRTSCMRRRECPPACPDPAGPGKLAGEAAARTVYARAAAPVGVSPVARGSTRRRPAWLSLPLNARLAAALVAAAVGPGGAAAHAEAPPGPIQDLAHRTIGASAAHHVPSGRQAGYRLCDGYERAKIYGPARAEFVAAQKLARAAGGADTINAHCVVVWRPSRAPASHPSASAKAGAKGKAHARGKPRFQPGSRP